MTSTNNMNHNQNHTNNNNMKNELKLALNWILNTFKMTPLPYAPEAAALKGHNPKKPFFFDGKYGKPLDWGDYKDLGKIQKNPKFAEKLFKQWFENENITAIGAIAGFNGEFIVAFVDFDLKNYPSKEAMMSDINNWIENYPALKMAPKLSSQSGGIHVVVGFERVDTNNNSKYNFTLTKEGKKAGELFVGSGSSCIIVGEGLEGNYLPIDNAYGEIPVFENPESIGIFESQKEEIKINNNYKINSIYDDKNTTEEAREALSFIPVNLFDEDYQGWINIGMACHSAGLTIDDWDNWSQGSKKYKNFKDIQDHWKSFKVKDGGGITAATLFKAAIDNGWKPTKQQQQTSAKTLSKPSHQTSGTAALKPEIQLNNVVALHSRKSENLPPIKDEILKLFDENLSSSELEDRIQSIAQAYNRQPNNVWKQYHKLSEEKENEIGKDETKANLDKLLRLSNKSLNLSDYLHPNLATPLKNIAIWMGTSQEAILTTLLPVAASLIHLDTQLELIKALNFYANPIIYSGIVAESGSLKSPTQKLLTNPLMTLQEIADKDYDLLMQYYQEDFEDYRDSLKDKNNPPLPIPTPPKRREYFVVDVTSEAVAGVQADQPERGFLGFQDELKALISSQNAYRGGRGSDAEKLLSGRDGSGIKVNRAGGKRLFCKRSGYSITGGIQPDVLKQLMGTFDDPNGFWARFIWCILPVTPSRYPENAVAYDANNLLLDVYKKLESETPQIHKLSPEAKDVYKDWYNQLDDLKLKEIRQGLRAIYSKMKGVTGEFALILHRLNAAVDGCQPDEYISKDAMAKAIKLAKFYITQIKLIHADGEAEQGEIAPQLKKLYEFALTQNSWLSASDIKKGCRLFKKSTPEDIRQACLDLVEMGYGSTNGEGKSLKYCADIQKLTKVDAVSISKEKPETIDSIGLQENNQILKVDKVDKKLTLCQPTQTIDSIGLQPLDDAKVDKLTHNQDSNIDNPLDVPQNLGNQTDILEPRQLCQLSPSNPYIIAVDTPSTSVNFSPNSVNLSTFGERSPEPETEPLDFDNIKEGDILFDTHGQPHQITGRTRQLWQSHRKDCYISRNDIQIGAYHRATVEDITKLIGRTIKGKNKAQAKWLCDVYGDSSNSLMAKSLLANDSLLEIYDFDEW